MMKWGAALSACGLIGGLALTAAGAAQAQEPPDDPLDQIRAQLPPGEPGEYDLTEADIIFGTYVQIWGVSSEVDDFGDGSSLEGPCGGYAISYDNDGQIIDAAMDLGFDGPPFDMVDGGQAFTADNPFKVDTNGLVEYYGFAPQNGDGPIDHRWFIKTSGVSVDSGGDPNSNGKNRNQGIVDLENDLPVKFSAKVRVEGEITSNNITCTGYGHVEFIGNGLLDPAGIASILLLGGGIFGLLFNARPAQTWKE